MSSWRIIETSSYYRFLLGITYSSFHYLFILILKRDVSRNSSPYKKHSDPSIMKDILMTMKLS